MSQHPQPQSLDSAVIFLVGLLTGGLLLGTGLLSLYYTFGWEGGELNQDLAGVGFTGLDNIGLLSAGNFSFGLIAAGLACLVILNANAWKSTGGY